MGKDFSNADKNRTFSKGGDTMAKMNAGFMAMIAKKKDGAGMKKMSKGGSAMPAKMGSVPTGSGIDGVASKGKTKGKMVKMNMGGRAC